MSRDFESDACPCRGGVSILSTSGASLLSKRGALLLYGPKLEASKKRKKKSLNLKEKKEAKPLEYPDPELNESFLKTFQIKYQKKLSSIAKFSLNSLQNKYLYYAIDDILYSFESNPIERDNLLAILYSPVISLQNNFSIHFFDIWIHEIYIHEVSKVNKFLKNDSSNFEEFSYITIKLLYKTRIPKKKKDTLW